MKALFALHAYCSLAMFLPSPQSLKSMAIVKAPVAVQAPATELPHQEARAEIVHAGRHD